jgi:hypothetical protein
LSHSIAYEFKFVTRASAFAFYNFTEPIHCKKMSKNEPPKDNYPESGFYGEVSMRNDDDILKPVVVPGFPLDRRQQEENKWFYNQHANEFTDSLVDTDYAFLEGNPAARQAMSTTPDSTLVQPEQHEETLPEQGQHEDGQQKQRKKRLTTLDETPDQRADRTNLYDLAVEEHEIESGYSYYLIMKVCMLSLPQSYVDH